MGVPVNLLHTTMKIGVNWHLCVCGVRANPLALRRISRRISRFRASVSLRSLRYVFTVRFYYGVFHDVDTAYSYEIRHYDENTI